MFSRPSGSVLSLTTALLLALAGAGPGHAEEAAPAKPAPAEKLLLKIYDVQDLILQIPDYPGPAIDWYCQGGGSLPVFSPPPSPPCLTTAALQEMIRKEIQPESWEPGKGTLIEERAGRLVVVQTREAHNEIEARIRALREKTRFQLSVKGLLVAVDAKIAEALRVRKSPEFTAEEAEALVKSAGPGGLLAAPQLLCFDGQRNHAWAGRSMAFFGGYYMGMARGSNCGDPCTNQLLDGAVLDVRPTLLADRSAADVEVRFALGAEPDGKLLKLTSLAFPGLKKPDAPAEPDAKPIPDTRPPATMAVTTESDYWLPSVPVFSVRTSVTVPLGRYVLAGMAPAMPAAPRTKGSGEPRTVVLLVAVSAPPALPPPEGVAKGAPGDRPVPVTYDLRELTALIPNFPGQVLGVAAMMSHAQGGAGGAIVAPSIEFAAVPPGSVADLVKRTIEPDSWGVGGTMLEERSGFLTVNHRPAVHRRIAELIATLRADQKRQLSVEGRLVAVSDETAARLRLREGAEFPVEEVEALTKPGAGQLLAAPRLLCYHGQRASLASARTITHVSGLYDADELYAQPMIDTESFGCVLDVRPLLSSDRSSATLEARLTLTDDWRENEWDVKLSASAPDARGKALSASNRLTAPSQRIWTARVVSTAPVGKYVLVRSYRRTDRAADKNGSGANVLMFFRVDSTASAQAPQQH